MLDVANGEDVDAANIGIYQGYGGNAQKFVVKNTNTSGVFTIATRCSNGARYLDVNAHKTDDGTNVIQYRYNGNQNQQWQFEKVNGQPQQLQNFCRFFAAERRTNYESATRNLDFSQ